MKYNIEELRIAITKKCNMNCEHCYSEAGQEAKELPISDFESVIGELIDGFDFKRITETGGEPLLPDKLDRTLELAKFAKESGIESRLVTNGYFLNDDVAKELKRVDCNPVQVSLDSNTAEIHDNFRRTKRAHENAINAIGNLVSNGIYTTVRYSIFPENKNQVLDTYRLAQELGASEFVVKQAYPCGRAEDNHAVLTDKEELIDLQKKLIISSIGGSTKVNFLQPFLISRDTIPENANIKVSPCKCGTLVLYIDSGGDVFPCNYMVTHPTNNFKMGNISDPDFDIVEAWNYAPELNSFRKPLHETGCCTSFKHMLGDESYAKFFEQRKFGD